jgi:diguanylate cyclase (GGDEF)-like protein/PAS domain S-box-containing protein
LKFRERLVQKMALLNRKVQVAFGSAVLTLLLAGGLSYHAIAVSSESNRWVRHTHEVLETLEDLLSTLSSLESSNRGFALTGNESSLGSYTASIARLEQEEATLRKLTADNPEQQGHQQAVEALAARKVQFGELVIGLRRTKGFEPAADAIRGGLGDRIMSEFQREIRGMQDTELRLLVFRDGDAKRHLAQTKFVLIFGTIVGIVIAIRAGLAVRRYDLADRDFAEKALLEGENRFKTLANNIPQLAWMADEKGWIFWYNDRWFDYTGTTLEDMAGWGWKKVHHPDHVRRVVDSIGECFQTGEPWEDTFPLRDHDGNYRWFLSRAIPIRDSQGKVSRWFGTNTDISDCKGLEEALFAEKERAQVTLNCIGDAVICTDIAGKVTFLNRVAERMTGWSWQEAAGRTLAEVFQIIDGVTREVAPDPMEMAVVQNKTVALTANCVLLRRDGSEFPIEDSAAPIHDRAGVAIGAVIVFHDVSATRAISLQMAYSAQHDYVTDLPNRLLLNDRITLSIALAVRNHHSVGVLFLDLDHFKYVNDSLGHAIGDQLLQHISKRLRASVRASDTVSRQGGDEFVILLSELTHPEDAAMSAKKLLLSLNAPCSVEGHSLHIDGSIGISIYPADGENAVTLIKNADTAMYHAKECGRNNFQFFTAGMNLKSVLRQSIETDLRSAIERNEFVLYYQPKMDLVTREITGVEALLRWQQPERGLVPPAEFVPVAEDCGLIVPIGRWVMRQACRQAREWQAAGLPFQRISINVSAAEFREKRFVEHVATTLAETGLDPRYFDLELTEGVLMADVESTSAILRALKNMGIHLAVDDFGTGYSSLSYLRQFPIDVLKIDQSFIRQISADPDDSAIVSAIIDMGKNLKQRVIAEGIETEEQLAFLQAHHCAEGQGYLFSRPLPAFEFGRLLEDTLTDTVVH